MKHFVSAALLLLAKLTSASEYDGYYDNRQQNRKYVNPSDDLKKTLESLSTKDQVDLMLETL